MTSAVSDWQIGRREGGLPEGWAETTLEEVVAYALGGEWGGEPGRAEGDPELVRVRVIRGTEFRNWDRDRGRTAVERAIKRSSLAKRRLEPGDLVVEISGGGVGQPVGRTVLIDEETVDRAGSPLVCSNFCRQVRVHPVVDPAFLHLALNHQYANGGFDEYQTQTTNLRNLNFPKFLAGVILRLPPLAEQRRIVARVRELTAPVARAEARLAQVPGLLRRLRLAVLAAAYSGRLTESWRERQATREPVAGRLAQVFARRQQEHRRQCLEAEATDQRAPRRPRNLSSTAWEAPEPLEVPEIPDGWSLLALQDVLRRSQYGTSARAAGDARTGVPVLRMSNIQDGRIDLTELKYVRSQEEKDLPAYALQRGDILFNRTNSPELVGKAAVFDEERTAVFASYLIRLECDPQLVESTYVCGWINSPWGRFWARTVRADCVSQSNINAAKLLSMPVPVPPLAEQRETVRRIEDLLARADGLEQRLPAAEGLVAKLRRTILDRALGGELVPTEAESARLDGRGFEPASELIDRIRAGRLAESARPGQRGRRPGPEKLLGPAEAPSDKILAAIRQSCWGVAVQTREELIQQVARRLGCPRFGKVVRARLEMHLETARERRIIGLDGDLVHGATPTFGRYDFAFLIATMRSLLKEGETVPRADLVQAVAAHLGYSQATAAIQGRMERVFQDAVRNGVIAEGERGIRRLL